MKNLIIIFILSLFTLGCVPVDDGHTLVEVTKLGSNKGEVEVPGPTLHWINPIKQSTYTMPNSVQEEEYDYFNLITNDNQELPALIAVNYNVNDYPGCSKALYSKYRKDIDKIIRVDLYTSVRAMVRGVAGGYPADGLYGSQVAAFQDSLSNVAKLGNLIPVRVDGETCLQINEIKVLDVEANDKIKKAVENKLIRNQEVEEEEANTRKVREKLTQDSLSARIAALNNQELQRTITPEILELRSLENERAAIDKWDGRFPTFMVNGGQAPDMLMSLPSFTSGITTQKQDKTDEVIQNTRSKLNNFFAELEESNK